MVKSRVSWIEKLTPSCVTFWALIIMFPLLPLCLINVRLFRPSARPTYYAVGPQVRELRECYLILGPFGNGSKTAHNRNPTWKTQVDPFTVVSVTARDGQSYLRLQSESVQEHFVRHPRLVARPMLKSATPENKDECLVLAHDILSFPFWSWWLV